MTNQELYYDILLKKYNVLKKNLIIIEQTEEKINEFENTIKEIEKIEQERFKKELELKKELTTNLIDESERLYNYINLLEDRNNRRTSMLEDFNNIIKGHIEGLEPIEDYDNLDFYIKRLEDINDYLSNDEKYNKLIDEKTEYINIKKGHEQKEESLKRLLEDYELNILLKLKDVIHNNKCYDNLDFDDLDESITIYEEKLNEKEKELSTFLTSYKALLNIDLVESEKEDYFSFVEETKKDYIDLLEKKYILLLYKYINNNENEKALDIYNERVNKLKIYDLEVSDCLKEIFDIINNYLSQKEYLNEIVLTIESVDFNINEIEKKIEELKKELNKPNILSLLKEFCIEKEYIVNNNDELLEDVDVIVNKGEFPKLEVEKEDLGEEINIIEKEEAIIFDDIIEKVEDIDEKEEIINNESIDDNLTEVMLVDNTIDSEQKDFISDINENDSLEEEIPIKDKLVKDDNLNDMVYLEEEMNALKENLIKDIKDINEFMLIDEIRIKSLNIMKSVCESLS